VVFGAVGMALAYGRERLDRSGIQSLGIDGIAWGRGHRPLILDWFRAKGQYSSGVVEGFNGKAKLTTRKAYGFQTYHGLKVKLIIHLAPYPSESLLTNYPGDAKAIAH
jgi:hypothetical protein